MQNFATATAIASDPEGSTHQDSALILPDALQQPLKTEQLFRNGNRQVIIEHGDVHYSLRLTRENKLILTK